MTKDYKKSKNCNLVESCKYISERDYTIINQIEIIKILKEKYEDMKATKESYEDQLRQINKLSNNVR